MFKLAHDGIRVYFWLLARQVIASQGAYVDGCTGLSSGWAAAGPGFNFDDMFDSRFSPKYLSGAHWLSNDKLAMAEGGSILLYDPVSSSSQVVVTPEEYAALNASSFKVSLMADDLLVLVASNSVAVYRHSRLSQYRVFDVNSGTWVGIDEDRPQQTAIWGADGTVAFVREHNIYLFDFATESTIQVTSDGTDDGVIRNGIPDWVYEEEVLGAAGAMYFSDSGRKLAYLRFDDTDVPQFNYTYWGNVYPDTIHLRYPKPGFDNPRVLVKVYDLDSETTVTMQLQGSNFEANYYVYEVDWFNATSILVRQQNRAQNTQEFVVCEVTTGVCSIKFTERIEDGWLCDKCTTHPLPDRESFVHSTVSSQEDSLQIAEYSLKEPGMRTFVTTGGEVTNILGTFGSSIVYQRTGNSPMDRRLVLLELPGSAADLDKVSRSHSQMGASLLREPIHACPLPDDEENATFTGLLAPSGNFLVCNYQGDGHVSSIPYVQMQSMATPGESGPILEKNDPLKEALHDIGLANLPTYRWIDVPAAPDAAAQFDIYHARLLLPPNFDEDSQYQVLVKVYGGPRSQAVTQRFPSFSLEMFLASKGIIVAEIDGRGTAARGSAFRTSVYRRLGEKEVVDQLWFGKWLQEQSFVESSRPLAMYGSSYGGYMTLMSLAATDQTNPFGIGVSSAPVTDWKYYDTIYTERFMGMPEDNPTGYDSSSVFSHVNGLQGKPVLLAHGTGDDNVHFQNSVMLINALIADSNQDFDVAIYPNRQHSISEDGARPHLFRMIVDFLSQHFVDKA